MDSLDCDGFLLAQSRFHLSQSEAFRPFSDCGDEGLFKFRETVVFRQADHVEARMGRGEVAPGLTRGDLEGRGNDLVHERT